MNIILLEKVHNLGLLGDQVAVKSGFARNYLIPQKKAVFATSDNIKKFEQQRAQLEAREQEKLSAAKQRAEHLAQTTVTIDAHVGEGGKLFGSIGTRLLSEAITEQSGVEVAKHEVRLPQGVLRYVGDYDVLLQLHSDVSATIKVKIAGETDQNKQ